MEGIKHCPSVHIDVSQDMAIEIDEPQESKEWMKSKGNRSQASQASTEENLNESPAKDCISTGSDSLSSPFCRICMDSSETESKLIKPCDCSGSQMYIHFHCLKSWIETSNDNTCGVCRNQYQGLIMKAKKVPFASFLQAHPQIQFSLIFGICAALIAGYIILIGFMTSSVASSSEIFFLFKFLLSYSNAIFLFVYLILFALSIYALRQVYVKYVETHKSYTVGSHEPSITREVIESQTSKQQIEAVTENQQQIIVKPSDSNMTTA